MNVEQCKSVTPKSLEAERENRERHSTNRFFRSLLSVLRPPLSALRAPLLPFQHTSERLQFRDGVGEILDKAIDDALQLGDVHRDVIRVDE